MSTEPDTLLLGLGNPVLRDDAVGLIVASRLYPWLDPQQIELKTASVGGLGFIDLITGYRRLVMIDALLTSAQPIGHVHFLRREQLSSTQRTVSLHDIGFGEALEMGAHMGLPMPSDISAYGIEVHDPFALGKTLTPRLRNVLPQALLAILRHAFPSRAQWPAELAMILRNRRCRSVSSHCDTRAGVAVALRRSADGALRVLLIKRAESMRRYPGQWAFPGGMCQGEEHPFVTMAREAHEEMGWQRESYIPLGRLDPAITAGGEILFPFVLAPAATALDQPWPVTQPATEFTCAQEFALDAVFDAPRMMVGTRVIGSWQQPVYSITIDGQQLNGATARILLQLAALWRRYSVRG